MFRPSERIYSRITRFFRQTLNYALQLLMAAVLFIIYLFSDRRTDVLVTSGVKRKYLLHVPPSYKPGNPTPLVITIHGFAEWPAHVMHISRWNRLADKNGFIVVYPSGTGFPKHWLIMADGKEQRSVQNEVQFIQVLISHLEKEYSIDRKRIYANGFSNGGGMAHVLAEKIPDQIAAIGIVSGALVHPLGDGSPKTRNVPLIGFHGAEDPIVPMNGGPSRYFSVPFPSIPDWMREWAGQNGCAPIPERIFESAHVTGIRYPGTANGNEVVFYIIGNGGHSWPGGLSIQKWIVGHTSTEINATELMWQFFEKHPLENVPSVFSL